MSVVDIEWGYRGYRILKLILLFVGSLAPSARPCDPSPCGVNAFCRERLGTAICECLPDYRGNPYEGCHPECLINSDCSKSQACIRKKCQDPCIGTCGIGAICTVTNHVPVCSCPYTTVGDAFNLCQTIPGNSYLY